MQIEKIVLTKKGGGKEETTFLNEMLGERWSVVQVPLPHGSKAPTLPELRETYNGVSYEFVASKVFDDGFGGTQIEKIVLTKKGGGKEETTFLNEMLGERWSVVQVPLPHGSKAPTLPELRETYNGVSYEFVASKVFDDGTEPWGGQKKCLRMVFAAAAGEGLPLVSLQDELDGKRTAQARWEKTHYAGRGRQGTPPSRSGVVPWDRLSQGQLIILLPIILPYHHTTARHVSRVFALRLSIWRSIEQRLRCRC